MNQFGGDCAKIKVEILVGCAKAKHIWTL
jgi:hypothetical protein